MTGRPHTKGLRSEPGTNPCSEISLGEFQPARYKIKLESLVNIQLEK